MFEKFLSKDITVNIHSCILFLIRRNALIATYDGNLNCNCYFVVRFSVKCLLMLSLNNTGIQHWKNTHWNVSLNMQFYIYIFYIFYSYSLLVHADSGIEHFMFYYII